MDDGTGLELMWGVDIVDGDVEKVGETEGENGAVHQSEGQENLV